MPAVAPYRRAERFAVAPPAATRPLLAVVPPAWNDAAPSRAAFAPAERPTAFEPRADWRVDALANVANTPEPAAPVADSAAPTLEEAQALANAGAFDEAERVLAQFSAHAGSHADAFYLNGLIADARGRVAEAGDFYRKALYLRPTHHEALTHLATLLDVGGDGAGAQWLLERARRSAG
jgi:chemotaxis protein methyltransferase WspC